MQLREGVEVGHGSAGGMQVFTQDPAQQKVYHLRRNWRPGVVYMDDDSEYGPTEFEPDEARALAAALLRAADEAEGRKPSSAERDLLDFISRAGWDGSDMVRALVNEVRREGK